MADDEPDDDEREARVLGAFDPETKTITIAPEVAEEADEDGDDDE